MRIRKQMGAALLLTFAVALAGCKRGGNASSDGAGSGGITGTASGNGVRREPSRWIPSGTRTRIWTDSGRKRRRLSSPLTAARFDFGAGRSGGREGIDDFQRRYLCPPGNPDRRPGGSGGRQGGYREAGPRRGRPELPGRRAALHQRGRAAWSSPWRTAL